MNVHLPQTEEARTEAATLMDITNNLITARNGEPLVAATQDFLTGSYLVTQKDVFYSRADFCRFAAFFSDANEHVDIPQPAILKPVELWTGKQLMTLLVCPNKETSCRVNVESREKFYTQGDHLCWQDGFVCFRNGIHISGSLGKKTLGGESKNGLFYVLIRDFGAHEATRCMSRLAKFCARYIGERGFSIGIEDVTPSDRMKAAKASVLSKGYQDAMEQIDLYNKGKHILYTIVHTTYLCCVC
jgi:DNA-directed RNA polymerase III subunit RPC1